MPEPQRLPCPKGSSQIALALKSWVKSFPDSALSTWTSKKLLKLFPVAKEEKGRSMFLLNV